MEKDHQFTNQDKICKYCSENIKVNVNLQMGENVTAEAFTCPECNNVNIDLWEQ